jgi:Sperm-tail PG-rich repeat
MESPGPGAYEAVNLAESPLNTSIKKKGTSMFRASSRKIESLEYPTISKLNPTLAPATQPGPGAYFEKKQPFLKKSYNASLPRRKFY